MLVGALTQTCLRLAGIMEILLARVAALPYDFPPGTEAVRLPSLPANKYEEVTKMAAEVTPPWPPRTTNPPTPLSESEFKTQAETS